MIHSVSPRAVRLAPNTFQNQNKQRAMKIVTGFKTMCEENVTNFKSASTVFIALGFKICYNFHRTWFDLILECFGEPRVGGSEGGHLLWFCHGGVTVSRYFVKFAPEAVTFSSRFGNA